MFGGREASWTCNEYTIMVRICGREVVWAWRHGFFSICS